MRPTLTRHESDWNWCDGWLKPVSEPYPERLVLKLGGSLLSLPGWPRAISQLLASEHAGSRPILIVVGGGPPINGLRQLDAIHRQPAHRMHRLAIEAMSLSAQLVAETLNLQLTTILETSKPAVLDLIHSPSGLAAIQPLPQSWDVTSDSIAAAAAEKTAAELLLVKPAPPNALDISRLACSGWLDRSFPAASKKLPGIRWIARTMN